jgi:hypothetical protein
MKCFASKYVYFNSTVSTNNIVTENYVYTCECSLSKMHLFIFNCKSLITIFNLTETCCTKSVTFLRLKIWIKMYCRVLSSLSFIIQVFCDLGPHTTSIKNSRNTSSLKAIFVVKQDVADKLRVYHPIQGFISGDLLFYAFMYTNHSLNIWHRTDCKKQKSSKIFSISTPSPS